MRNRHVLLEKAVVERKSQKPSSSSSRPVSQWEKSSERPGWIAADSSLSPRRSTHREKEKAYRDPIGIRIVEMRKQSPSLFYIIRPPPLQPACPNGEREKALLLFQQRDLVWLSCHRQMLFAHISPATENPFPFFSPILLQKFPALSPIHARFVDGYLLIIC